MTRVLSGIQPTGEVHLGNYLGALRHWVADSTEHDSFYCIVDLHAITMGHDPEELRERSLHLGAALVAIGLDPGRCTLFLQSHVPEHSELCWLLSSVATMGELRRMTQYKEKSSRSGGTESVSVGLFTYPVLQAADILIYDADRVPVGDDQRQHIELTRDIAGRFNHRFGDTFVIPEAAVPPAGARIMDLQEPTAKMSKSIPSDAGRVDLFEDPDTIRRKFKRAVTDSETEVRYNPETKPGVSNLLGIIGALTGEEPAEVASRYSQYGPLKADAAEVVVEATAPLRDTYTELLADPGHILSILETGAVKAQGIAASTLARAKDAMGFLPRAPA